MLNLRRLFEPYNPLDDRMGTTFFEELPQDPGIYKMLGRGHELLYVGKAKNIRKRLFTYRRAKMGATSRKVIRLIRMTHSIDIELCESEKEALLLENKLIRNHKPEFNHAKKQPDTYYFIGLDNSGQKLSFSLQMHHPEFEYVFGAFKGHRLVRSTMGGIIRLFYILDNKIDSVFDLPSQLTWKLTPMEYELPYNAEQSPISELWKDLLCYLRGKEEVLIERLTELCAGRDLLDSFVGNLILDDLKNLKWFYERCSSRNYKIRKQLELDSVLVPQEKLDDYFIEWAFQKDKGD